MMPLEFDEVKTENDKERFIYETCSSRGLLTMGGVTIIGILFSPLIKYSITRLQIKSEIRMVLNAFGIIALSFYSGIYVRDNCEAKLQKKFSKIQLKNTI